MSSAFCRTRRPTGGLDTFWLIRHWFLYLFLRIMKSSLSLTLVRVCVGIRNFSVLQPRAHYCHICIAFIINMGICIKGCVWKDYWGITKNVREKNSQNFSLTFFIRGTTWRQPHLECVQNKEFISWESTLTKNERQNFFAEVFPYVFHDRDSLVIRKICAPKIEFFYRNFPVRFP